MFEKPELFGRKVLFSPEGLAAAADNSWLEQVNPLPRLSEHLSALGWANVRCMRCILQNLIPKRFPQENGAVEGLENLMKQAAHFESLGAAARFIHGESCAEIGERYGRTEESINGWVCQALLKMKVYLEAKNLKQF